MVIARSLVQALRHAGHTADIVVTPQNRFGRQASAYLATWFTDVGFADGHPIDQVISLRYPSYAVRHPNHVCWLNHTMREYYDLWDSVQRRTGTAGRLKERVRRFGITCRRSVSVDAQRLALVRAVANDPAPARDVAGASFRGLYPPAPQRAYRCDGYGDYVFLVSRLTRLKRVDLFVEALAQPGVEGVRAVISGEGEERASLEQLASARGLADRVTFTGRLSDEELLDHLARCRVVCFPPFEEDYGFVTAEAFASRKAVITCGDSGGPAELVQDGVTGLISESTAQSLGAALRRVMTDPAAAKRMGEAAFDEGATRNWPNAVKQLTR